MPDSDLKIYCQKGLAAGASGAQVIDPAKVVTAPWVRLKCQFGCGRYGTSYCCPPDTPDHKATREVLDSYRRAILFHFRNSQGPSKEGVKAWKDYTERLVELEGECFKGGFNRALVFLAGPCLFCRECNKRKGEPCAQPKKARPSMEACGIDVFQTARDLGLELNTLKEKDETSNIYCLLLVD